MGIKVIMPGDEISFTYKNHRDKIALRKVKVIGVDWGENEWYPEPGWFLRCEDLERPGTIRSFRFDNIIGRPFQSTDRRPT